MSTTPERRRFSRIAFTARTDIQQDEQIWPCELLDLSLKGLLVEEPNDCDMQASQPVSVRITLTDDAEIRMEATLARRQEGQLGFICREIDVDSISHLRRLVELNLGDPDAANRELFELIAKDQADQ